MKVQTEKRAESLFLSLKKKESQFLSAFYHYRAWSFSGILAAQDRKLSVAPVNKAFLEYLSTQLKVLHYTADGHPLGLIPGPRDLSYLKNLSAGRSRQIDLPVSYDLRTLNRLTPVRNQGSCGSCWAFATYGSLESF